MTMDEVSDASDKAKAKVEKTDDKIACPIGDDKDSTDKTVDVINVKTDFKIGHSDSDKS